AMTALSYFCPGCALALIALPATGFAGDLKITVSIPAGNAQARLHEFMTQTSCSVTHDTDAVADVTTRGVSGRVSPQQALDTMFSGTSFTAAFIAPPCEYALVRNDPSATEPASDHQTTSAAEELQEVLVTTGSFIPEKISAVGGVIVLS